MITTTLDGYSVKGIKTWSGRTGCPAFSGTLMLGRAKVASFHNDGNGGALFIQALNRPLYTEFVALVRAAADLAWPDGEPVTFEREGYVISRMVDDLLEQKQLARWCRTSVVFRMQGDPPDQYRRVTIPKGRTAQEGIAHVRSTYGDKVLEIVNERIGA